MKLLIICIFGLASTFADNEQLLKNSNDQFTAKMFQEVVKAHDGKSVILSAFSVLPPLAMLSQASSGPSHDELLTAIDLPNDETTKEVFSYLNQHFKTVKGVTLKTASRIYIAQDAKLNKDFEALSRDVFNSDVKNVDFSKSKASADEINAWVEQQTNNKIKKLVDPDSLDQLTRSILVNAIYFKGSWSKKFDSKLTQVKDFHVSTTKTVKVPTMQLNDDFKYGESAELDAKLLELPYEGGEASFLIVLPNAIDGLANLEKKLQDPSVLDKAIEEMYKHKVDLSMPKFKIETSTDLKEVLEQMKVTKLFSMSEAKLDKLLDNESDMFVSGAIQKAFIEVNEEGAEAGAANAFIVGYRSARVQPIVVKKFVADHPFYFAIRHRSTSGVKANTLFDGVYLS